MSAQARFWLSLADNPDTTIDELRAQLRYAAKREIAATAPDRVNRLMMSAAIAAEMIGSSDFGHDRELEIIARKARRAVAVADELIQAVDNPVTG